MIRNIATFVLRVKILCSLSELDGYVVVVSTFTSRSGNEFFDVKLKVSESKTVTVRILKQAKPNYCGSISEKCKRGRIAS